MHTGNQLKFAAEHLAKAHELNTAFKAAVKKLSHTLETWQQRIPLSEFGLTEGDYFNLQNLIGKTDIPVHQLWYMESNPLNIQAAHEVYVAQQALLPGFVYDKTTFLPVSLTSDEARRALQPIYEDGRNKSITPLRIQGKDLEKRFFQMARLNDYIHWEETDLASLVSHAEQKLAQPFSGLWTACPVNPKGLYEASITSTAVMKVKYMSPGQTEVTIATPISQKDIDPMKSLGFMSPDRPYHHLGRFHRYFNVPSVNEGWQWLTNYHLYRDDWLSRQSDNELILPSWAQNAMPHLFWKEDDRYVDNQKDSKNINRVKQAMETLYDCGLFPFNSQE